MAIWAEWVNMPIGGVASGMGCAPSKAIKLATKHNEVISTMCHGVSLALLISKLFF